MSRAGQARPRGLIEGSLAAVPALAGVWVIHGGAPRVPFAPTALADRIVRETPGNLATAAIEHLGHSAQLLLSAGLVVGFVALAAVLSALARRPMHGAALWGCVTLASGLLAPVDPSAVGALGAAALAAAIYGLALHGLRRPWRERAADTSRRRAITAIGGASAGLLVAAHPLGRAAGWLVGAPRRLSADGLPHSPLPQRPPFPAIAGLTPEVTLVAEHYVVDIDINLPQIDGPTWRLEVRGLVERPLTIGFLELQREFPLVEEISVLSCISNKVGGPLVGNSRWQGVRLADLLRRAGPRAQATDLVVQCADGYTAGIPRAVAEHPAALVAIAQDGEALSRQHGFPCRLRLPALYGMLNPKWVTSIELVDRPYLGYWAQQGWSPSAVVRTESRIDTPRQARVGVPTWIAGVAWAGIRGISRVEVSLDGGSSWLTARLRAPLSPWAWTQWALAWTPSRSGTASVVCRATDGAGAPQDPTSRPAHPSGASGYHRVQVAVT